MLLDVVVGTDGHVTSMEPVLTSDPYLTIAAESAVRHWRYAPLVRDGVAIEAETMVSVHFNLQR